MRGMERDKAARELRALRNAAAISAAGLAVATATDAASQREALGLGTAAVENADALPGTAGTSLIIENRTSDPGTPEDGRIWLRTDL